MWEGDPIIPIVVNTKLKIIVRCPSNHIVEKVDIEISDGEIKIVTGPCRICHAYTHATSWGEGRIEEQDRLGKLNKKCYGNYESAGMPKHDTCQQCEYWHACRDKS